MREFDAVRLFMAGDEYDIREISAMSRLLAMKEASELSKELEAEGEGEDIVLAAAITAGSAYLRGEKAFASAKEAMDILTAGEILEAASVNAVPRGKATEGFPELSAYSGSEDLRDAAAEIIRRAAPGEVREILRETARRTAEEYGVNDSGAFRAGDIPVPSGGGAGSREPEAVSRTPERFRDIQITGKEKRGGRDLSAPAFASGEYRGDLSAASYRASPAGGGFSASAGENGAGNYTDVRYISDFFERDSRSYGGAFERF